MLSPATAERLGEGACRAQVPWAWGQGGELHHPKGHRHGGLMLGLCRFWQAAGEAAPLLRETLHAAQITG